MGSSSQMDVKIEISKGLPVADEPIPISKRTGLPTRKYVFKSKSRSADHSSVSISNGHTVGPAFVDHITALVDKLANEARQDHHGSFVDVPFGALHISTGIQPSPPLCSSILHQKAAMIQKGGLRIDNADQIHGIIVATTSHNPAIALPTPCMEGVMQSEEKSSNQHDLGMLITYMKSMYCTFTLVFSICMPCLCIK